MKRLIYYLLFSFLILVITTNCSYRLGDFTILSTKNVELGAKYEKVGIGEAKDEVFVFYIPWGSPNLENAVDKILDEQKGDLLTNAVVSSYNYSFLIGVAGYKVKGDVWKRADLGSLDNTKEYYQLSQNDGELFLVSCKDSNIKIKAFKKHNSE